MDLILASKKADKTMMEVEGVGGYYGECIVGLILPEDSKEEVIKLQKGDFLPLTLKTVSWWYNDGNSEFKIIFLGEYDDEYTPGEYYGFYLAGFIGNLNGFSNEFIAKSFHMTKTESEKLIKDQSRTNLLIKINEGTKMPHPCNKVKHKLVFNLDSAKPCVEVKNGGVLSAVTCRNLPLLGDVGLSANRVVLESGALFGPIFTADLSVQLSFVTKGSGRVQIVGPLCKVVLDTKVEEGGLFFVPKFFPFVVEADEGGMEFFPVITSSKLLGHFKSLVRNKSQSEGSIAEGHKVEEVLTLYSRYFDEIESRLNRPKRVNDEPNHNEAFGKSSMFPQQGKPIGGSTTKPLTTLEKTQAHRYVLFNCAAVKPFIEYEI
ncbi:hypothetical protein RDI58_002279 [Solanum bulbocastanum]|uniref:Cupin type-1 domain-containing protein n=1 Tax=Solanum bulbocastanum TaxID=147425 RepID=A0AAN8YQQ5_SOLBU